LLFYKAMDVRYDFVISGPAAGNQKLRATRNGNLQLIQKPGGNA
jgi:hypothetical protein